MSRQFKRHLGRDGPRTITWFHMTCAKCGVITRLSGSLPEHILPKKFGERGWHCGASEKDDLCPAHVKRVDPYRDPERPIVDRVMKEILALEDALQDFSALKSPKHSDEVMAALTAFKGRIFGDDPSTNA